MSEQPRGLVKWIVGGDHAAAKSGWWTVKIVKRSDTAKGFEALPGRWMAERTLAWLNRNRHLTKDFEQTIASVQSFIKRIVMI